MSRFKKLSHTIYECKYHIIFCPKYRYPIFEGALGEYAKQQVYHLAGQKDLIEVEEINVQPDHVHTILSVPPKYSISGVMGFLKGKMALNHFGVVFPAPWGVQCFCRYPAACGGVVHSVSLL